MGARDRAEGEDERHEGGAGRDGIGEERQRHVAAGESLGHDPRADDGGEQERGADRFRHESSRETHGLDHPRGDYTGVGE